MEGQKKKCSSKKHSEIDAVNYCQECQLYLCDKCTNLHCELFDSHQLYKADENLNEIFIGFCKMKDHNKVLEYYCKDHNQLCYAR